MERVSCAKQKAFLAKLTLPWKDDQFGQKTLSVQQN